MAERGQAAWTLACSIDMYMQHGHEHGYGQYMNINEYWAAADKGGQFPFRGCGRRVRVNERKLAEVLAKLAEIRGLAISVLTN
jgi:hypothetical protein